MHRLPVGKHCERKKLWILSQNRALHRNQPSTLGSVQGDFMSTPTTEPQGWRKHRLVWIALGAVLVLLLGVIAKNALHRYVNLAQYAKRAEAMHNLNNIYQAQLDHFAAHGEYVAVGATPQQPPGKRQRPFESEHMDGWKRLGWQPESMVRCQYEVTVPTPKNFRAVARCDVDGDGEPSIFVGSAEHPPKMTTPEHQL